jgi:hypothetical protein
MNKEYLGQRIYLVGKSQRGIRQVKKHGHFWTVLAETDHVLFTNDRPGPWLFIVAEPNRNMDHDSARWIHADQDQDFSFSLTTG